MGVGCPWARTGKTMIASAAIILCRCITASSNHRRWPGGQRPTGAGRLPWPGLRAGARPSCPLLQPACLAQHCGLTARPIPTDPSGPGTGRTKSSACLCPAAGDYALPMFDPGRAFLAAVERESDTTAIADGKRRLSYAFWYEEIARVAGGLTALGLRHGDRWLSSCRTGSKMASLHWACQLAGIVVRPLKTGVSSPRSWTIASPMPTPPGSSSTMSRRIPSPARRRSSRCRGSQSATSTGPPAVSKTCKAARTGSRREPGPTTCRCCSTPRARPEGRRACRAGTAPSAPPPSPMSRRTCTPAASARSASCRSTTRWACARCWRWRS